MKPLPQDPPVACALPSAELREREATLLAQFRSAVTAIEELVDGYAFRLPGDRKSIAVAAEMIVAERECCPFLAFELAAHPNAGPMFVRITGPVGTKEFLRAVLCKPEASV
jgi:hypothetical protein